MLSTMLRVTCQNGAELMLSTIIPAWPWRFFTSLRSCSRGCRAIVMHHRSTLTRAESWTTTSLPLHQAYGAVNAAMRSLFP